MALTMLAGASANVDALVQLVTTTRVTVEERAPIDTTEVHGAAFSLMPQAIAQDKPKGELVRIGGKAWFYADPTWRTWKVAGEPALAYLAPNMERPLFVTIVDAKQLKTK